MARRVIVLLLAVLANAAPAIGGEPRRPAVDRLEAVYDLYLGGLWGGMARLNAEFGTKTYRGGIDAETGGIIGFFYPTGVTAESVGQVGDRGLTPDRFTADAHEYDRRQSVEISYAGGTPVAVRAEPPYRQRPWSIAPEEQTGIADPLSAGLEALAPAPLEAICDRTVVTFDGEYRWGIEIGRPQPPDSTGRIRCDAAYIRLAGFKKKLGKRRPFELWFADRGDGLYRLVRAAGETSFGVAVVLLRD